MDDNFKLPPSHYGDEWMLVGRSSQNSMLVRGGENPVAIRVKHSDSLDLQRLLSDANAGIAARNKKT